MWEQLVSVELFRSLPEAFRVETANGMEAIAPVQPFGGLKGRGFHQFSANKIPLGSLNLDLPPEYRVRLDQAPAPGPFP